LDLENQDEDGTSDDDSDNSDDSETKDPIDEIDDVDELRKLAKKRRAIDARVAKKARTEAKKATKPKVDESKFVTKDDFYKGNEKKATRALTQITADDSEEEVEFKKDLKANWKEVMGFYRDISGRETVDDIVEDVTDAYNAFRRRNPRKEVDESKKAASVLGASKGTKGKTPSGKPAKKQSILQRKHQTGIEQVAGWYPEDE
jgi:hypothetical protein